MARFSGRNQAIVQPRVEFEELIKAQLATFLRYQNQYWKKRFTVNRIRLEDECTKFFHAMATVTH